MGQDKPKVEVPKPRVVTSERVQWGVPLPVVRLGGRGNELQVRLDQGSRRLIRGDLDLTVQEMERCLEDANRGDPSEGLAALDAAGKAVMKFRRLLAKRDEPRETSSQGDEVSRSTDRELYPVWSRNGQMLYYRGRNGELIAFRPTEPMSLRRDQSAGEQALFRLRQAGNVDEATRALDEVEQSVITLRVLLWERKDSKRD